MKTQKETERLRGIEQDFNAVTEAVTEAFGDALGPEMISLLIGTMMAAIDATFAIRDGEEWRGLSDPKEIARKLLREAHLGE